MKASQRDTETAKTWLQIQGWPVMPDWAYPDLCYAVPGKAAVWLFTSNSGMCWVEYLVGNPLISKEEKHEAISHLLSYVAEEAKKLGAKQLITSTPHPGAARAYLEAGYVAGDTNCTQYLKYIGEA